MQANLVRTSFNCWNYVGLHIVYGCPSKILHKCWCPTALASFLPCKFLMLESPTTTVIRSFSDLAGNDVASAVLPAGVALVCCLKCLGCSDFFPVSVAFCCCVTVFGFFSHWPLPWPCWFICKLPEIPLSVFLDKKIPVFFRCSLII